MAKKLNDTELQELKTGLLIYGNDYPLQLLSKIDASKILGISRVTLNRWIKKGYLIESIAGISTTEIKKCLTKKLTNGNN